MKHSFIDQYSDKDSVIHRLDPRIKFITALVFILAVVLTPPGTWLAFALFLVFTATLILMSRVPVLYILKRSLVIIPFVVLIAIFIPFFKQGEVAGSYNVWLWKVTITHSGVQVLINLLIKSWLSILALIWLSSTTRMTSLLNGMEQLRVPRVMVMILSFMYRYIFILTDEVMRMKQARDSRNFGGKRLWQMRTIGNMVGTLFIRSYERGERVYSAMVARGFEGHARTLNHLQLRHSDIYFGTVCCLVLVAVSAISILPFGLLLK